MDGDGKLLMYKIRPGVILAEVCGQYLLAASKGAREYCPYTTQVNETSAFLWKQMDKWVTLDDLMGCLLATYEVDNVDEAEASIETFLQEMTELGYLMTKEEDNE